MSGSVTIIGGGIAGLAAGCYARMNGFDAEVVEMHTIPGGLCTAWKRQGYTCDLCIHWLTGSAPGSSLYPVWEELGLVRTFRNLEYFTVVFGRDGKRFTVWADPDRLHEEMLRLSPEDKPFIDEFILDMKKMERLEMPVDPRIRDYLRMFPSLYLFRKYALPASELAAKIKNPEFRDLFFTAFDWHDQSALFLMFMISYMGRGAAGYPLGGSLPFARALESRFLSLGGKVRYRSRVGKILVENNRAVGVLLDDGMEIRSDITISAADAHTTIFQWLDGKYVNDRIREAYTSLQPYPPLVFVSLGIAGDYSKEPNSFVIGPDQGAGLQRIIVRNHADDPSLAPPGKTVFSVMATTRFDEWAQIPYQSEEYRRKKEIAGEEIIGRIATIYPEIRDRIEMVDIATPPTFVRYTGNWQGSYQGWLWTRESMKQKFPQQLPGLSRFYMAGHWTGVGGGIPGAAMSARNAVKLMCRNEGKRFVTTKG